jgi:hypothetical protein
MHHIQYRYLPFSLFNAAVAIPTLTGVRNQLSLLMLTHQTNITSPFPLPRAIMAPKVVVIGYYP